MHAGLCAINYRQQSPSGNHGVTHLSITAICLARQLQVWRELHNFICTGIGSDGNDTLAPITFPYTSSFVHVDTPPDCIRSCITSCRRWSLPRLTSPSLESHMPTVESGNLALSFASSPRMHEMLVLIPARCKNNPQSQAY